MASEQVIYDLTRAVYKTLGSRADEHVVEELVTEVYRAVEPLLASGGEFRGMSGVGPGPGSVPAVASESTGRLVISAFGVDRPGIVASVAEVLATAGCSILDINQTVVQGKFAMVLIADITASRESAADLKERFRAEGDRLGVRVYAQREDIFNAMHRI